MITPGQGPFLSNQFGMPLYGIGGTKPFSGYSYWVDETNGSDGNTGGPSDPFKTLTAALAACKDNNNDVVFLTGTVHTTATITWSKNKTHLIGLDPDTNINPRARISQTGSTVFSPLVSVTGAGCIFENIGAFHGFNNASAQICWQDLGGNNSYFGSAFLGMANATAAAQAGGRSLVISGNNATNGENYFERCQIGLDTVTRSAANASLEFLLGTPRNVFRNCIFPVMTSNADALCITAGASSMDRFNYFDNCAFINDIASTSTTMTVGIVANAGAGGMILLQNPISVGMTNIAADGPVYGTGPVPTGTTTGIAVAITD